jgi:hypothetical protein
LRASFITEGYAQRDAWIGRYAPRSLALSQRDAGYVEEGGLWTDNAAGQARPVGDQ